ncbi:tyrosine--tRNA ligase, partial [candidate division WOR-3 bacterium]|nr:tyrosine--tRNA ligase [candidate division WOR-3 bacterium]
CITVPILEGLDGVRKMSKSYNNYISIKAPPDDMFGKIMSIPDSLIMKYYELCTDITEKESKEVRERLCAGVNPMDIKTELAREIVAIYHSENRAVEAKREFMRVFRERRVPEKMDSYILKGKVWIVKLLKDVGFATTGSEARRLITQGAVELEGEVIKEIDYQVEKGGILKVGKRRFIRLILP